MHKIATRMYNFSILEPLLEEMGYTVYYVSENILTARKFPYHFKFLKSTKGTEISFHLDMNRVLSHITRRKNTSKQLLPEYHEIVKRYKIEGQQKR
jgi:hypothetical protein